MSTPEDRIPISQDVTRVDLNRRNSDIGWRDVIRQFLPERIRSIIPTTEIGERNRIDLNTSYDLPANTSRWQTLRNRETQRQMEIERNKQIDEELRLIRSGTGTIGSRQPSLLESFIPLNIREMFRPSATTSESPVGRVAGTMVEDLKNPISMIEGGPVGKIANLGPYISRLSWKEGHQGKNLIEVLRHNRRNRLSVENLVEDLDELAHNLPELAPSGRRHYESLKKLYNSGINVDDLEEATRRGIAISSPRGQWEVHGDILEHVMEDNRLLTVRTIGSGRAGYKFEIKVLPTSTTGSRIPGGKVHEYIAENPYDLYNQLRNITLKPPIVTDLPMTGARSNIPPPRYTTEK